MRYYALDITNPKTGKPVLPPSLGGRKITSLDAFGGTNPAALNIEFDLPVFVGLVPDTNGAWLRIYGLSLSEIGAAFDLNGMNVSFRAGMAKGLPLANPKQQNMILKGTIYQAFGNWMGLDQTLDLNFIPPTGTSTKQINFPFKWQKGTKLADAISETLKIGAPDFKHDIRISDKLVINYEETGFYQSLQQFNDFLNAKSKDVVGGNYPGVLITTEGATIKVVDQSDKEGKKPTEIDFWDLIGQPTWIDTHTISVKTVLRGDLTVGDDFKLPPGPKQLSIASGSGFSPFQNPASKTSFNGTFNITKIHHYGNFRQPDAESWNTTIEGTTAG